MIDHNEIGWCVVLAVKIELAADELNARGIDVHVPMRFWRDRVGGRLVRLWEPMIPPYMFCCFALDDNEQHSQVLRQRGVRGVLINDRGRPSRIDPYIVIEHRRREYAERLKASAPRSKDDKGDFELLAMHVVKQGSVLAGHKGKLIAVSRGVAHLDCDGRLLQLPVTDIMAEVAGNRRAA